jgi:lipid-A-disaccharide synthase-like uncharacterized protein
MKWEPLAAMVLLFFLGIWLVSDPMGPTDLRPGAEKMKFLVGNERGTLELVREPEPTFRVLLRNGWRSQVLSAQQFKATYGDQTFEGVMHTGDNRLFRFFNITGWGSLVWVFVGFAGQGAFFGRMALQWVVSEREKKSVVPESFWWMSLFGGIALFAYFVWRQDAIAMLGQTSGVVIYARNIRLIHKQRRRAERQAARDAAAAFPEPSAEHAPMPEDDPNPEPVLADSHRV